MRSLTIIPVALLSLLGAATPVQPTSAAPSYPVEQWTLDQVSRKRVHKHRTCKWKMAITQSATEANGTTANSTPVHCKFSVRVPKGHDCAVDDFGPVRCSKSHHGFYVSAGHNEDGFVAMVVENVNEDTRANFAFLDATLDSGRAIPPQTSTVRDSGSKTSSLAGRESGGDKVVWSIPVLARRIDTGTNTVFMSFAIDGTNGEDLEPVPCTLYLQAPDDVVDLAKWQFYNMKCQESGFYVSWGYLAASDAGIMTLVSPTRDTEAFFGFSDISKSEFLTPTPDGGVVEPCDCGGQSH
ncbi:hypothetical protein F4823DRAFT_641352 [Ustulina deusta]|nr:hypothetical protein F4823DRAFT_641352 [Ustulina deusta]